MATCTSMPMTTMEIIVPTSFSARAESDEEEVVLHPGPHDVLLGRGGGTNNYRGNIKFRKLVNEHKIRYLTCSKVEKPNVAREVVALWRKLNPPGRFLAKRENPSETSRKDAANTKSKDGGKGKDSYLEAPSGEWVEVGDKKAREKASQCLRERTPDVLPLLRHMREQQDAAQNLTFRPAMAASASTAKPLMNPLKTKQQRQPSSQVTPPEKVREDTPKGKRDMDRPVKAGRTKKRVSRGQGKVKAQTGAGAVAMVGSSSLSPPNSGPPRVVDISLTVERDNAQMGLSSSGLETGIHAGAMADRALACRNSITEACSGAGHLHPVGTMAFVDRHGCLNTMAGTGIPASVASGMGAASCMPYAPNATSMMQMQMQAGKAAASTVCRLGGLGHPANTALGNIANTAMDNHFAMPGQASRVSAVEAAAFRNASPYLDLYDPSHPLHTTALQFHRQQLKLQQLQLEQQQLQQKLESQLQLEMEVQLATGRHPSGLTSAAAAAKQQQLQAGHLMMDHTPLPPPIQAPSHPLTQHLQQQQQGHLQLHHQQMHHARGVEAPGYLPQYRGEDMEAIPSALGPEGQQEDRERSDPPSKAASRYRRSVASNRQLAQDSGVEPPLPRTSGRVSQPVPPKIPREVSRKQRSIAQDISRQDSREDRQHVPNEVSPVLTRTMSTPSSRSSTTGSSDPDRELTLDEYRSTLDAYVTNNNISINEEIYTEDEEEEKASPGRPSTPNDLAARTFGEWRDGGSRGGDSRNESPRPDPPAHVDARTALPHIPRRRVQRQQSSASLMSAKTSRSSFTSFSGMSGLSDAIDSENRRHHQHQHQHRHQHQHHRRRHADDASQGEPTADGKMSKNFSSNESVVSEITVISHTMDGLGLEDDE